MREIPVEKIATYGGMVLLVILLAPFVHKIPRSGGTNLAFHLVYLVLVALAIWLVPEGIQHECFSPGGIVVLMNVVPLYDSIAALCTVDGKHNRALIQYWVTSHAFTLATEFVDDITNHLPSAGEHWYEFEFFLIGWLMNPFTDGAGLLYTMVTSKFLRPLATRLKNQMEGYMLQLILVAVNTSFLWYVWFLFLSLPEEARRFLTISLGTIYPMIASTAVIASGEPLGLVDEENDEERFWLAYWASYSVLFLAMDYLENFVGSIAGFYSACALATIYLFLPMFKGANVILRRVLIPLSGQRENLIVRDAHIMRHQIERLVPNPASQAKVLARVVEVFTVPPERKAVKEE